MKFCLEIWGTNYEKIKDTCIFAKKMVAFLRHNNAYHSIVIIRYTIVI
jgi:hypothetical protein